MTLPYRKPFGLDEVMEDNIFYTFDMNYSQPPQGETIHAQLRRKMQDEKYRESEFMKQQDKLWEKLKV